MIKLCFWKAPRQKWKWDLVLNINQHHHKHCQKIPLLENIQFSWSFMSYREIGIEFRLFTVRKHYCLLTIAKNSIGEIWCDVNATNFCYRLIKRSRAFPYKQPHTHVLVWSGAEPYSSAACWLSFQQLYGLLGAGSSSEKRCAMPRSFPWVTYRMLDMAQYRNERQQVERLSSLSVNVFDILYHFPLCSLYDFHKDEISH